MPRRPSFEVVQYHQRVLELDPIAYWIQDEKVGLVSYDWVRRSQGSDQDGAYTGVTLGEPGIGDGRTSPYFDGVNDFNNVFGATFRGRFDGAEGTVMCWGRVANSGVWTDGIIRELVSLSADGNNIVAIAKNSGNNQHLFYYRAGGVIKTVTSASGGTTDWYCLAMTWSASAGATGEMRGYLNGIQVGATQVNLGVWAGALGATRCCVGAFDTVPVNVYDGYLAHAAVWDRALTPQELS